MKFDAANIISVPVYRVYVNVKDDERTKCRKPIFLFPEDHETR